MHLRKAAWRNVLSALALVTFALPLATPLAQTASAADVNPTNQPSIATVGSTINGSAGVNAPVAFNPIGTNHTVTFVCNNVAPSTGTTASAAGCYGVTASVQNSTTGGAATFALATCGGVQNNVTTATVNCFDTLPGVASGTGTSANQATVTMNSGTPNVYTIIFSGYTPAVFPTRGSAATCPAGTTGPLNVTANGLGSNLIFLQPLFSSGPVCQFILAVQKKYVEVTNVTITPGTCTGQVTFSEGLKAFFGPQCNFVAAATGTVVIKTGVTCTTLSNGLTVESGMTSADASAEFGPGATYTCTNGNLAVTNISSATFAPGGLPFTFTSTGPGSLNTGVPGVTLNGLCAGTSGATTATGVTAVSLCATGIGSGTVQACYTGGSTVNTQPPICSANATFTFTAPAASRVIPIVRWAGEKAVLTKCFGGAGVGTNVGGNLGNGLFAGALVQFSLQADANTQAVLIPAVADVTGATAINTTGPTGGATSLFGSGSSTVYTTADQNGCASVIVYARNEGVVNVDAAIYSTVVSPAQGGVQLINEHAFSVYYLKFDHIDLENITMVTYNTATALQPSLTFTSATPASAAPGFPASFPGALAATFKLPNPPGTGQVAGGGPYAVPACNIDYVRAMVHGYFEMPGDPSGRPASNVAISGATTVNPAVTATTGGAVSGTAAVGSYVLPAGRWVLPEDWPVLATFAGFTAPGTPLNPTPSSVLAWDLNSGWVFNPGGENADLCFNPGNVSGIPSTNTAPGPITTYNTGPCFGNTASTATTANTGLSWVSAPGGVTNGNNCNSGVTVGIGPFDPTQACLVNANGGYGVPLSPPGSTLLQGNPQTNAFTLGPLSTNSTYLPNGTLNEWDAPMPPAQVTFAVTGGPGFLNQVNKTGLYSIALGTVTSATLICPAAPTGSVLTAAAAPGTACTYTFGQPTTLVFCQGLLGSGATSTGATCVVTGTYTKTSGTAVFPNPFYAEAIPASPLIPPITNNGGYLWDTFGFRGGTVVGFTPVGAIIPGESITVSPTDLRPGGLNTGATCTAVASPPAGTFQFRVSIYNAAGFAPGMTVTVYSTTPPYATLATGLQVVAVNGNTLTLQTSNVNPAVNAGTLASLCSAVNTTVFEAEQIGIPVPNTSLAALTPGQSAALQQTNGVSVTGQVYGQNFTANNTGPLLGVQTTSPAPPLPAGNTFVYFANAQGLAQALANCVISRTQVNSALPVTIPSGGTAPLVQAGNCEPGLDFLGAHTLVTAQPQIANVPLRDASTLMKTSSTLGNTGPYPFWQWVGASAGTTARPTSGTVYSDNHGEAVVSLETGLTASTLQAVPVAGTCPAGYQLAPATATTAANCLLNLAQLGLTTSAPFGTFQNVQTATGGVAAPAGTAAGCFNTTATGGAVAATGATAQVGANGPANGQICVNSLGGVEFGPGAVLGTSTVQAVADYPYTRGDHAPISSAPLMKAWTSAFSKTLTVTPGPASIAGTGITNYTVTISAFDICGNALVGEPVQVFALGNAGAVVLAPIGTGSALGTGNATVVIPASGTATLSLEVLQSALGNQGLVIKAVFPREAIERIAVIQSGTAGQTTTVLYGPGYNQVGGPAGSNFSMAEAVFSYNATAGTYANATASAGNLSSAAPTCAGYWAYFAAATAVNLPATSTAGQTASCTLAPGFNLIGNPFASPASIQTGFTAYHWNGTSYDVTQTIPVGGSVFIFNPGTASATVTLTAT